MPSDLWDRVSFSATLFVVVFAPLAYGSVETWSRIVVGGGILTIVLAWVVGRIQRQTAPLAIPPFLPYFGLFFLLLLFQILSLPPSWRDFLSPSTAGNAVATDSALDGGTSIGRSRWSAVSVNPSATVTAALTLAGCLLFCMAVYFSRLDRWKLRVLLTTLLALGTFEAGYGLLEYWSGRQQIFWLRKSFYLEEVTGTYINHNHFAGLIELILPLAVGLFIIQYSSRHSTSPVSSMLGTIIPGQDTVGYGIFLGAIGLMGTALVFSRSRGGLVSFVLSLACLIYLLVKDRDRSPRINKVGLIFVTLLGILVAVLGREVSTRFSYSVRDAPERFELWVDSFRIVRDFPWWGTGLGTYKDILPNYRPAKDVIVVAGIPQPARISYAHNDYLQLLVECGVVGLVVLIWAMAKTGRALYRGLAEVNEWELKVIGFSLTTGMIALACHGLVDFNFHIPANALIFSLYLALALKVSRRKESFRPSSGQS